MVADGVWAASPSWTPPSATEQELLTWDVSRCNGLVVWVSVFRLLFITYHSLTETETKREGEIDCLPPHYVVQRIGVACSLFLLSRCVEKHVLCEPPYISVMDCVRIMIGGVKGLFCIVCPIFTCRPNVITWGSIDHNGWHRRLNKQLANFFFNHRQTSAVLDYADHMPSIFSVKVR